MLRTKATIKHSFQASVVCCTGFSWDMMLCFGFGRKTMVKIHWCLADAEQCCTKPGISHTILPGLRGHKELGGYRMRTSKLSCPKSYSIPHNIMWKRLGNGRELIRQANTAGRLGISQWVMSNYIVHHSFSIFCHHYYCYYPPFLFLSY